MRSSFAEPSSLVLVFLLLTILNLTNGVRDASLLQTAKQWKLHTYNFPPNAPVDDENFYSPTNILITGIAVGYDRIFVATPQLFSGVSATVSFVSKTVFTDSPMLQAYPDWSYSTTGRKDFNCSDLVLVSVYRLRIDSCNRLWALDAGISRSLEDYEITCPPKILVFDLNTNEVVRRIDFPREVRRGETLFTNLVIDETTSKSGTCDDVFVYITDTVEPAIVVYDSERDVTWRMSHPAMYPDPDFAQSELDGYRFILMDGVVGLTFDEKTGIVYFQPLATDRVFSITKDALRAGPLPLNQVLAVKLVGKKSSQGIGMVVSPIDGSLLFSPITETAIASWNPNTNQQSVLVQDQERLQFVADIITSRFEPGAIYMISSKFHRFFLKNLNTNEINNRILRIDLPGGKSTYFEASPFSAKPISAPASQFGSFYHQTNSIDKNSPSYQFFQTSSHLQPTTINSNPSPNFFTSAALSLPRHPFRYEAVINHSVRNPFTVLNQGEALTTKQTRHQFERSFLDNLATAPGSSNASVSPLLEGYHYHRGIRSTPLQKLNLKA